MTSTDGIGVSVSHLYLCSVGRMIGLQGRPDGRLGLSPRDEGSEEEGSRIIASVTLNGSPRSELGREVQNWV